MLVKCPPLLILSYRFINKKKVKGDNLNPLKINKRVHSWNSHPL